ncbi:branched-chain amino acid ABC transporter permease [Candidatus Uhrbacteria bacterium]|nr:branched-chain amino acid ABC transporter permease [Candidatus Uhrbacteria bacterium]
MAYLIHLAIFFCIYAILSVGLNLIMGFTGLLSVSQAAFYGLGAYTTAIMITQHHWGFFPALIAGIVVSGFGAFLIGLVLSRFKGDYYALGSIGFSYIIVSLFTNWDSLTRGALGIAGISRPSIFGLTLNNFHFLILAVVLLIIVYLAAHFVSTRSFGRVLRAIREDEKATQVFGYNTQYFKLAVLMIGGAMAAVAGSLFATYITFIDPTSFVLIESIFIMAMIILGGLGSLKGSLLGALILVLLPELLRFAGFPNSVAAQMRQLVYGILLVLLMIYRPQGLIGEYKL